jgi:hypothetical protein
MFSPNVCPYSCKKIARIQQHPFPHGGVLRNRDFLHLSNNILHPYGGLMHLKIDPRNKIECSRFTRKVMYSNFEREKNSQLLEHHLNAPSIHIRAGSPHKGQRVKDSLLCPIFLLHQMFD